MKRRELLALCATPLGAANEPRRDAPDFHAVSRAQERFSKASLKGRVVLIQFWATWCGFCRKDQQWVDEVYMDLASKGLAVLAVNTGEPEKKITAYLTASSRVVPVVLETETNLMKLFPARGLPAYLVLDRAGKIAAAYRGALGYDGLKEMLKPAGLT